MAVLVLYTEITCTSSSTVDGILYHYCILLIILKSSYSSCTNA